jgi:hypothetical protein
MDTLENHKLPFAKDFPFQENLINSVNVSAPFLHIYLPTCALLMMVIYFRLFVPLLFLDFLEKKIVSPKTCVKQWQTSTRCDMQIA